jgi:hypothetical protein
MDTWTELGGMFENPDSDPGSGVGGGAELEGPAEADDDDGAWICGSELEVGCVGW